MSVPFSPSGFGIDPGGGATLQDPFLIEQAFRAAVICAVLMLLLGTSLANIIVLWCRPNDVITFYLISLSFADFFCALLIIPFSLYSSLRPGWHFTGDNSVLCKCTVYFHVVLISATVFTFAWISVDRYAAFMKPNRYEVVHTATRCKCWILFSWITSLLIACPILITKMESKYSAELELCLLNWTSTMAYSVTLAVLVLVPSLCTVAFTSTAIIAAINKPEELEDLQRTLLDTDQNFIISLFLFISFMLSWLPIIVLQLMPDSLLNQADAGVMRFAFSWLAIGGGSSKLLIYSFTSKEFRQSLCCVCLPLLSSTTRHSPISQNVLDQQLDRLSEEPDIAVPERKRRQPQRTVSQSGTKSSRCQPPPSSIAANSRTLATTVDYGSFGLSPTIAATYGLKSTSTSAAAVGQQLHQNHLF